MNLQNYVMLLGAWVVVVVTLCQILKHRHKWYARAVDHGVMSEPRRNATAILYVCASCGEARSSIVAGTYELEDFQSRNQSNSIHWSDEDKKFAKSLKLAL